MPDKLTRSLKDADRVVYHLNMQIDKLTEQLSYARELVLDCFNQACRVRPPSHPDGILFDHQCLSAYEEAQEMLLEWGLVEPEQCVRINSPCCHEYIPSEEYYDLKNVPKESYSGLETCRKCQALRIVSEGYVCDESPPSKHKEDSQDPPITS